MIQRVAGSARGRTHLLIIEGGFLPEPCRVPQFGRTPLHVAAGGGHAAVVEQLLAAGAAVGAGTNVRGFGGTRIGEGWVAEHSSACPVVFLVLCFSQFGAEIASRITT